MSMAHVILVEPFAHKRGHFSVEAANLARAFATRISNVTLVSFSGFAEEEPLQKMDVRQGIVCYSATAVTRQPILALYRFLAWVSRALFPNSVLIGRLPSALETWATLHVANQLCKKSKADLTVCVDAETWALLLSASFTSGVKFLCVLRDYSRMLQRKPPARRRVKRYLENLLSASATAKNEMVFACTVADMPQAYRTTGFKGNCVYVPPFGISQLSRVPGMAEARTHLQLPQSVPILLVFGSGHDAKDFESIFKSLAGTGLNVVLLFAGKFNSGSSNDPLRLARRYGLSDKAIIVDQFIPEREIPYYFAAADGLVISFKKGFVGNSAVLVQAIGLGIPVIASDVASTGTLVKRFGLGLTFAPEDPRSLREAIAHFVELSSEDRRTIRDNMRRYADEHQRSWDSIAEEYLRISVGFSATGKHWAEEERESGA